MKPFLIFLLSPLLLHVNPVWVNSVWAARGAEVTDYDVPVYEQPSLKSKVIYKLGQGAQLVVSNLPTKPKKEEKLEFYKIRLRDRRLGWVEAKFLDLKPIPTATPEP